MALTLPTGLKINFKTGTFSDYNNLPLSSKTSETIYLIDDNNKFYLYSGTNPIHSQTIAEVDSGSTLPVTSSAVYNYVAQAFEVIDNTTSNISDGDMQPGRFYYTEDGNLKFKYRFGYTPLKIQTGDDITVESTYIPTGSNPINGIGVSAALNTIFSSVSSLPASGQGKTEKIYCLTTTNSNGVITSSDLYYYPSASSSAVKIATGDGFLLTSPTGAQTIEKDLTLSSGNLTLATGRTLTVDNIQKASTNSSDKITLNGNSAINGTLSVSSDITATNITAATLLKTNSLEVNGIISGENINITDGFVTEIDANSKKWVRMKSDLAFDSKHIYYITTTGSAYLNGLDIAGAAIFKSNLTVNNGHTSLNSLEASGETKLKTTLSVTGATSLNNTITTNYFNGTVNIEGAADKMTMKLPLYFGSSYYISTTGSATLDSLNINSIEADTLITSGSITVKGDLKLTKISQGYNFGNLTFEAVNEGTGENQSGSSVTGVNGRLVYGGQQVLTKADLTAANGLIKTSLDTLSNTTNTLNTTVNNNKTISDEMIIIAANTNGVAPASVTSNTKIWIDTAEGNGLVKIKTTDGTWIPVSSVWT